MSNKVEQAIKKIRKASKVLVYAHSLDAYIRIVKCDLIDMINDRDSIEGIDFKMREGNLLYIDTDF